jgi:hypothetical protein
MRTLLIEDTEYKWKVGKSFVLIRGPDNWKRTPTLIEATGGYHNDRDFEKRQASITPAMIEGYIRRERSKDANW